MIFSKYMTFKFLQHCTSFVASIALVVIFTKHHRLPYNSKRLDLFKINESINRNTGNTFDLYSLICVSYHNFL